MCIRDRKTIGFHKKDCQFDIFHKEHVQNTKFLEESMNIHFKNVQVNFIIPHVNLKGIMNFFIVDASQRRNVYGLATELSSRAGLVLMGSAKKALCFNCTIYNFSYFFLI